ncbi:MAG: hypothetical protein AAB400_05320 [Patescibacteria group bacterium]
MKIIVRQLIIIATVVFVSNFSPLVVSALSPVSTQLFTLPSRDQSIDKTAIKFSPNGKRFWYLSKQDDMYTLVVDGKDIQTGKQEIQSFAFSPDSKHYAYVTSDEQGRFFVVFDGTPNPMKYTAILSGGELDGLLDNRPFLQFSDTGGHYTYVGHRIENEKDPVMYVVIDGTEQKVENRLSRVGRPVLSHDGNHHGYIAFEQFGSQANTTENLKEFEIGNLIVDVEFQKMLLAEEIKNAQVIYDGKIIKTQTSKESALLPIPVLAGIALNPAGNHYAYITFLPNNKRAVWRGGRIGPAYDFVSSLTFNDSGTSFAYIGSKGKKWYVVFNDRVISKHSDKTFVLDLKLSSDGKHIGYRVGTSDIYIDGKKKIGSNTGHEYKVLQAGSAGIFYAVPEMHVLQEFERGSSSSMEGVLRYNNTVDNKSVAIDSHLVYASTSDAGRAYIGYDISQRKKECYTKSPCIYSVNNPPRVVVVNGKVKEKIPYGFSVTDLVISPHGKHYGYILYQSAAVADQEKWKLVVDGKDVNHYPYLSNLQFIDENTVNFNDVNGISVWSGIYSIAK